MLVCKRKLSEGFDPVEAGEADYGCLHLTPLEQLERLLRGDRRAAAIASERATEVYGLEAPSQENTGHLRNTARFYVLLREESYPADSNTTSLFFATRHVPGAL